MTTAAKTPAAAPSASIQRRSPEEIYASGDAFASCRAARETLASPSAPAEDKAKAEAFLASVAIDRMTKAVAGISLAVVLCIIAALYLFS